MKLRNYGLAGGGLAFAAVSLVWVSSAPAGAAGHHVEMENYAFAPRSLTVQRGDSVTWMNHDEAPHDAKTTSAPASFHSPMLDKGESWSHTFNTAGTYFYYCTVHPDMKAGIVVAAPKVTPKPTPRKPEPEPEPKENKQSPRTKEASSTPPQTKAPATTARPAPTTATQTASAPATTAVEPSPTSTAVAGAPLSGSGMSLSPLLLLSGLVTAVAVFCLLALASRPSRPAE